MSFHLHVLLFLTLSLAPQVSFGNQKGDCQSLFLNYSVSHPLVIAPTPGKLPVDEALLDPTVLKKLVQKVNLKTNESTKMMSELEDGVYVYLIDNKGNIAFMDRAAIDSTGKAFSSQGFIGTHEGLSIALDRPEVLAAGEFSIRGGKVVMFSNGSGTYQGATEHFEFAKNSLSSVGLKIDNQASLLDYSTGKVRDPHKTVTAQVEKEILLRSDPKLIELRNETRLIMNAIGKNYMEIFQRIKPLSKTDKKEEVAYAMQMLSAWNAPLEGEAEIILRYYDILTEPKYKKMLQVLSDALVVK